MQILIMLLTQFGPALSGLVVNLAERLMAGFWTQTAKAGTVAAGIGSLFYMMGCDPSLADAAVAGAAGAIPVLFGVPADQIVPTLEQAMRARVEQAKTSKAVNDAAVAEQNKWKP